MRRPSINYRFLHELHSGGEGPKIAPPLQKSVEKLLSASQFARRQGRILKQLIAEDTCLDALDQSDYQASVAAISLDETPTTFGLKLRRLRHAHLFRLALRELAGLAETYDTLYAWSLCADELIKHTFRYCERRLHQKYGVPHHLEDGKPAYLCLLAMGKLGGMELNYSSDIDLIVAFSGEGFTRGEKRIENHEFYRKLTQSFTSLMQEMTEEGFVFRVDLRLRPNGESAPLVCSLLTMETYYQAEGRDWERYAMVKARPINFGGDVAWFTRLVTPFVYRRYVDFSVIASLRNMKAMIEREIQHNPMLDDIKRGRGGIREFEFVLQSIQLIRGGRLPQLQVQSAMEALSVLAQEGLMGKADSLRRSYLFLRKLENAIQIQNDQQRHLISQSQTIKENIMALMGYDSWSELETTLQTCQQVINREFNELLWRTNNHSDEKKMMMQQLLGLWQGHVESNMATTLLSSLGFENAARCYQMLCEFRGGARCRRLTQTARLYLDRLMALLLHELAGIPNTDEVLLSILRWLENIVGRSAYLILLIENPTALHEFFHWFLESPFIHSLFMKQPFLLEVLLEQDDTWIPLTKNQLQQALQRKLVQARDVEAQNEVLRQFKLKYWLLVARAELKKQVTTLQSARFLTDVAEVIIQEVLNKASEELHARYPAIIDIKSRFAIVAYGKLGSREMNYDSDLDLVFLHSVTVEQEYLVTRLTQKVIHMLTMRSQGGVLYEVDTRLRPSGEAGLLVSRIDVFTTYQREQAWVWEHQALLKARIVFGDNKLRRSFQQLKQTILSQPKIPQKLSQELQNMRAKMRQVLDTKGIKHVSGGLLDLEFLVQFIVLSSSDAAFSAITNTLRQIEGLHKRGLLEPEHYRILKRAYQQYNALLHHHILQKTSSLNTEIHQAGVLNVADWYYLRKNS